MIINPQLHNEASRYRWALAIVLALLLIACRGDSAQPAVFSTPTSSAAASQAADSALEPFSTEAPNPIATAVLTAGGTEVIPVPKSIPVVVTPSIPVPPERDLVELAERFRHNNDPGLAEFPIVKASDVGGTEQFWLTDLVVPRIEQIDAILRLVTPHAAWYVGKPDTVAQSDLVAAAAVFEDFVYPRVTQAMLGFVPEPSNTGPGTRIAILNTRISGAAGYFATADLYNEAVYDYTNGRPMLYLDAEALSLQGQAFT
ncbi:uncharacterized protein METZ01_LOCUS291894, partial [marine metagenome]